MMLRAIAYCFLFTFASTICGCGITGQDIESDAPLTLHSLDGKVHPTKLQTGNGFDGFPVLGSVEITDAATRKKLIAALEVGIDGSDGTMAKCFWPRHALETKVDGRQTKFIICFECLQIKIISNGKEDRVVATTREQKSVFDDVLTAAGVELAP